MTSSRYYKSEIHRRKLSESVKQYFQTPRGIKASKRMSELLKNRIAEKSPNWNGGKSINSGYIMILKRNHPHATQRGYVAEHRLVMEKKIGRYLKPEEIVHHIDGNRINNHPDNLLLFKNKSEHQKKVHAIEKHPANKKEKFYLFIISYLLNENQKLKIINEKSG